MHLRRWAVLLGALAVAGYGLSRIASSPPSSAVTAPKGTAGARSSARSGSSSAPASTVSVPSAPPGQGVPILMYHVINAPPPGTAFPELWLPASAFAAQMAYLHTHGFHAVTLGQAWAYWMHGARLPRHPIVLSFDDGYQSQFGNAAVVMHRYHWPGVLNLVVKHVTERDIAAVSVRRMIDWGWEVDSHTVTHLDLTTLTPSEVRFQLVESRRWLRQRFGVPVDFFCYPAGAYDASVVAAVHAAGYRAATTVNLGVAAPGQGRYTLDRIRVNGDETLGEFAATLHSLHVVG